MNSSSKTITCRWGMLVCGFFLAVLSASAVNIIQTVDEFTGTSNWNSAVWGTPNVVPTSGGDYETPSGKYLRTTSATSAQSFAGNSLQIDAGGTLYLKHGNGVATANLLMNGGAITFHGAGGSNAPVGGTLQVLADSTINSDQTGTANRDIWLLSTLSGSANLSVAMLTATNALVLMEDGSAYSGNWTNTTGYIQVGSGTANPFGSGKVTLVNNSSSLVFNSADDLVIANVIAGAGYVVKNNTGSLTLTGNNTFTGGLTNNAGTLVLTGSGAQSFTTVNSDSVLRVASSTALPSGSTVRVNVNNTQSGRLELSNNVTIATGNALQLRMRSTPSAALESVSGNNVVSDAISVLDGGGALWIQADAGASLELASFVSAGAAGTRSVTLQGAGTGIVSGYIYDNAAAMSLYKTGSGTWTLGVANGYTGMTVVTNGVLKLNVSDAIASSPVIRLLPGGTLDATAAGLAMSGSQILAGNGTVLGDVTTTSGNYLQVGFTNQYGQLALSNNLVMNGGETIQFDVSSATNDVLNVSGTLTLNSSTTIEVALPLGFTSPGTYRLINYSGTIQGGGSFSLVTPVGQSSTFQLDTSTAGQVNLVVAGAPANLTWSGDGSGNVWDVNGAANWNSQTTQFFNGDNVTFNDSGSAVPDINVSVPVQPSSMTVTNTAQAYVFSGSGISLTGSLIKRGSNTLAFANDGNNFSGPISIESGTLSIGNGGNAGSLGTGAITNNGTLMVNHPNATVITLAAPISGTGSFQMAATDGTLGNNLINLSASNSYAGPTTVETNTAISVLNNNALGSSSSGTVVHSGGRVGFTALGTWTVAEPLEINGYGLSALPGALYANTISNDITWTGPITVGSASQIRLVNNNVKMTLGNTVIGSQTPLLCSAQDTGSIITFSNTLSLGNAAALTKDGLGTLVLAGATNLCSSATNNGGTLLILTTNTPQIGDVTVNSGTLQLGSGLAGGSMPSGAINLAGSGTKLIINSSNTFVMNNPLTGVGSVSLLNYGKLIINSSNTFTGGVTTGSGTPTLGGLISLFNSYGLGDGTVAKNVKLIHAALYLQGNLDIPANISFSTSSGASGAADADAGVAQVIRNVSGNNIIEGSITPTGGDGNSELIVDAGTLTLNGNVAPDITARTVILSGAGNGTLNGSLNDNGANIPALTKQGAGTWTLNNVNGYSGATVVQNGTLKLGVAATIANTPGIQILSNAVVDVSAVPGGFTLNVNQTLSGNGNVIGNVNAVGTVSPGASVGTLNFANDLALYGTTIMELNRTNAQNADLIAAANLKFGGTLTISNAGPDLAAGDTFNLFDGAINPAYSFSVTNLPALSATNLYWDVSQFGSDGIVKVASSTTPPVPTITQPGISGTNFTLQVSSQSGFNYILEATPQLSPAAWTGIQTNPGGGTLNFTIPITPGTPKQFFRINVQ